MLLWLFYLQSGPVTLAKKRDEIYNNYSSGHKGWAAFIFPEQFGHSSPPLPGVLDGVGFH